MDKRQCQKDFSDINITWVYLKLRSISYSCLIFEGKWIFVEWYRKRKQSTYFSFWAIPISQKSIFLKIKITNFGKLCNIYSKKSKIMMLLGGSAINAIASNWYEYIIKSNKKRIGPKGQQVR
ncbi:hypothetical protein C1645_740096 [Glomus cerebriforme]|uniref:Uncharacterized protein n=1 Tax=Glomus cerebriforme TaxID=658196 RepID=A0A397SRG3_9GLOM|nr:hypothetical protein C1645_740096 [Glomus cerebriforme]